MTVDLYDHGLSRRSTNVLILAHSGSQGGAELCLDTTLQHLDRDRFHATVIFAWEGPMVESARAMGYQVEVWSLAAWMCYWCTWWHYKNVLVASWWRIARLVWRIRREKIDLVYTNTAVIYEGAVAAWLARVPHVWHVHEVLTPEHMHPRMLPLTWIRRLIGRLSARVIFESDSARAIAQATIGREKCLTVYNSTRFETSGEGSGKRGEGRCVVAWVGRFSERKNPLLLIRAAAQMKELGKTEFVFAGEGPLEGAMCEAIDRLGLKSACRVLPFQPDIRPLLESCDLLALTSDEESFGLVLVEAGVLGKPVVATRTQGPTEIVADGQTGYLVPPGDAGALAARLDELVANPERRCAMGEAGAARVAELFSPQKNTRKIEAVWEDVLEASR